jgi:sterol desaturase/sphingolipid hydroxylase (fatty acid hydroxylase superfamily)
MGGAGSIRRAVLIGCGSYLVLGTIALWGIVHLLPDNVSFSLLDHGVSLGDLHHRVIFRLLALGLFIPAVFVVELSLVGWPESSVRHLMVKAPSSSMTDLACFLCTETRVMNALSLVMGLGVTLISGAYLHDRLYAVTGLSPSIASMSMPFQFVIFFFAYSFLDYWTHRIDHSRYCWSLHRYHHAAEDFCVFNSVRVHPAGVVTVAVPNILTAVFLGASPEVIVYVNLFVVILRYVIHSRINSNWGWLGRYLLQSPVHHRLHHILDTTEPTGHFSLVPLWDHLFGTWRGEADQSLVIGVSTPYRHGLWLAPDLWRDYCDFWKGLTRIGRAP